MTRMVLPLRSTTTTLAKLLSTEWVNDARWTWAQTSVLPTRVLGVLSRLQMHQGQRNSTGEAEGRNGSAIVDAEQRYEHPLDRGGN